MKCLCSCAKSSRSKDMATSWTLERWPAVLHPVALPSTSNMRKCACTDKARVWSGDKTSEIWGLCQVDTCQSSTCALVHLTLECAKNTFFILPAIPPFDHLYSLNSRSCGLRDQGPPGIWSLNK